jgi:hypothetical protein
LTYSEVQNVSGFIGTREKVEADIAAHNSEWAIHSQTESNRMPQTEWIEIASR